MLTLLISWPRNPDIPCRKLFTLAVICLIQNNSPYSLDVFSVPLNIRPNIHVYSKTPTASIVSGRISFGARAGLKGGLRQRFGRKNALVCETWDMNPRAYKQQQTIQINIVLRHKQTRRLGGPFCVKRIRSCDVLTTGRSSGFPRHTTPSHPLGRPHVAHNVRVESIWKKR